MWLSYNNSNAIVVVYYNLILYMFLFYLLYFLQDEYAQKTGLVSQALSFSDEQKKEVLLFFSHYL